MLASTSISDIDLLHQACPSLPQGACKDIVYQLYDKYPSMQSAVKQKDFHHIRQLYEKYISNPQSTTRRIFEEQGIHLGDSVKSSGDSVIYYARRGIVPVVLKKLMKQSELNGYQWVANLRIADHPHLVPFTLFKADSPFSTPAPPSPDEQDGSKSSVSSTTYIPSQGKTLFRTPVKPKISVTILQRDWCWMPHYPQTLDGMARPYSTQQASTIISQMLVALQPLHDNQLVHMDIKPANIFIEKDGNMSLGDFGSVRPFHSTSIETTDTFIPTDQRANIQAHPSFDFMMLAMTVVSMMTPVKQKAVGEGSSDPSLEQVIIALKNMKTVEGDTLVNKIKMMPQIAEET